MTTPIAIVFALPHRDSHALASWYRRYRLYAAEHPVRRVSHRGAPGARRAEDQGPMRVRLHDEPDVRRPAVERLGAERVQVRLPNARLGVLERQVEAHV